MLDMTSIYSIHLCTSYHKAQIPLEFVEVAGQVERSTLTEGSGCIFG